MTKKSRRVLTSQTGELISISHIRQLYWGGPPAQVFHCCVESNGLLRSCGAYLVRACASDPESCFGPTAARVLGESDSGRLLDAPHSRMQQKHRCKQNRFPTRIPAVKNM